MKIRSMILTVAIGMAYLAFDASPSLAQTVLRMGHCCPNETSGTGQGLMKWAELTKERTEGRVQIEVFPSLQLGSEPQMVEGMRLGTVDGGVLTDGNFQAVAPDFGVLNLPFAFASYKDVEAFIDQAKPILLKKLDGTGIVAFDFAHVGFRSIGNNRGPIRKLEDLEGLKIRVVPSPILTDTLNALGARGIPMGGDEIPTAMMQGIIDGIELGHIYFMAIKAYDYTKYFSATRELYSSAVFAMSQSSYDALSEEDRKIVADAASEAAKFASDFTIDLESKIPEQLAQNGMQVNDVDDTFTTEARKAVEPVWEKYGGKFDPALFSLIKR
jgi:TRAP-type transport system periplasmic protein